ncbi:thioesterase family protein [Streptomyces cocklensis]|uniref:TesB-like acyl-CoA thioesterase 5 n=1 Tax=Actinacidiphila cocklensis TaxID=887465 RepID=A0A9W4GPW9_9ACTN|nr:thioesterase family protein [Actinacidiphila cocklensis]MDD1063613.1 thioesterase family protein [Actinacidiphila cocklensis]WSX72995.1 thioesterase family protein [Streptomyces sp. NBC_00899]WSX80939.1 thioesterase family protein [Streptomyces sp. NBC_00899]CAG6390969.1 TesB-like acyl-CoA thioesterase 5 [Actinacidiphila cocklensis]
MTSEAFYRSLGGGRYESGPATAGPWSPLTQHAGPPSALVGRLMERHEARPGMRIARVTIDLPRPVPVGDLDVEVATVRTGGRTELLEGRITSGGREVLLARAWRMVAAPEDTPALSPLAPVPPLPGPQPPQTMAGAYLDGYVSAMEWRFPPAAPGAAEPGFDTPGPGTAWARQRVPLVAGEADTPLTRALTLADSSWAVGFELDRRRGLVINTDVTLVLHRDPVGEWMCLRSATAAAAGGSGLAQGELHDTTGDCGRILQTLLVTGL